MGVPNLTSAGKPGILSTPQQLQRKAPLGAGAVGRTVSRGQHVPLERAYRSCAHVIQMLFSEYIAYGISINSVILAKSTIPEAPSTR